MDIRLNGKFLVCESGRGVDSVQLNLYIIKAILIKQLLSCLAVFTCSFVPRH